MSVILLKIIFVFVAACPMAPTLCVRPFIFRRSSVGVIEVIGAVGSVGGDAIVAVVGVVVIVVVVVVVVVVDIVAAIVCNL